jgi:hypothetical protein
VLTSERPSEKLIKEKILGKTVFLPRLEDPQEILYTKLSQDVITKFSFTPLQGEAF